MHFEIVLDVSDTSAGSPCNKDKLELPTEKRHFKMVSRCGVLMISMCFRATSARFLVTFARAAPKQYSASRVSSARHFAFACALVDACLRIVDRGFLGVVVLAHST